MILPSRWHLVAQWDEVVRLHLLLLAKLALLLGLSELHHLLTGIVLTGHLGRSCGQRDLDRGRRKKEISYFQ